MLMRSTAAVLLAGAVHGSPTSTQDLIDYVNTPDPIFSWFEDSAYNIKSTLYTGHALNITSQTWLTPEDFVGPYGHVWTHQMMCIVPKGDLKNDKMAGIYATGSGQTSSWPKANDEDVLVAVTLALGTKSIVCSLFQIPNQDIQFANDPEHKNRGEDALVAYSWLNFINHGYNSAAAKYIVNLPMAKAVSAAMTTVQQFAKQNNIAQIETFLIAGASKRGWTTWLSGASDKRVTAIVPIVMDMLNFYTNVAHMPLIYGGWTFAFKDYCEANVTHYIDTPQLAALARVVDPLNYKAQLTMPKLVIDATGDEFFMPDDDYMWWGDLEGETYRLITQNSEHSEATGIFELLKSADGFFQSILHDFTRPKLDWVLQTNGTISATTDTKPTKVVLWHANSVTKNQDTRRDFRLVVAITETNPCNTVPINLFGHNCLNPVLWAPVELNATETSPGQWTVDGYRPPPAKGFNGYFLQFEYPGEDKGSPIIFTTQISIFPNTFPFPSCHTYPGGCGNCSAYYV